MGKRPGNSLSNMFGSIRYCCVIGILILGLLTIVGTGGDDDQHQIGLAVGLSLDGYGTIIYTSDGGQTWNEQNYGLDNGLWDVSFVNSYH